MNDDEVKVFWDGVERRGGQPSPEVRRARAQAAPPATEGAQRADGPQKPHRR